MQHPVPDQSAQPAAKFQTQARQAELSTYAKIFPWTCFAVVVALGAPLLLLDPETSLYSRSIAWSNGIAATCALIIGIGALHFLPADENTTARSQILLGGFVLVMLAFNNAWLVLDTNEARHAGAAVLTMFCVAFVYPKVAGLVVVAVPQMILIIFLAAQSDWAPRWMFALFTTMGGAIVAWLLFYTRRTYFFRHQALLAERASMIEALKRESLERVQLHERVLTERNLATLGRLAGGIAHDLNNILVPILGNAAMLEESVHTSTHQRQAREVMKAASRARSLTQQLGYFAARGSEELETLDLNSMLRELCPIVWRTFPQGVDIDLEIEEEPLYLRASRMDLQDLVTNLLLDASNAASAGSSVRLSVNPVTQLPENFLTQPHRAYCVVTIGDSSTPMTAEQRETLFAADQIHAITERGIGLRGAREKAAALGGFLGADSAPDGSNQFCLFLPIQNPHAHADRPSDPRVQAAVATEVLVVDDEDAVRGVTMQLLERAGFVVRGCESGEAAMKEIHNHRPDAIVMDLRMPGMGGRAATEAIRSENLQLPIVICTGYTGDAEGWLAELPNCALLQKPYDTADLIAAVNSLLHSTSEVTRD